MTLPMLRLVTTYNWTGELDTSVEAFLDGNLKAEKKKKQNASICLLLSI